MCDENGKATLIASIKDGVGLPAQFSYGGLPFNCGEAAEKVRTLSARLSHMEPLSLKDVPATITDNTFGTSDYNPQQCNWFKATIDKKDLP